MERPQLFRHGLIAADYVRCGNSERYRDEGLFADAAPRILIFWIAQPEYLLGGGPLHGCTKVKHRFTIDLGLDPVVFFLRQLVGCFWNDPDHGRAPHFATVFTGEIVDVFDALRVGLERRHCGEDPIRMARREIDAATGRASIHQDRSRFARWPWRYHRS